MYSYFHKIHTLSKNLKKNLSNYIHYPFFQTGKRECAGQGERRDRDHEAAVHGERAPGHHDLQRDLRHAPGH